MKDKPVFTVKGKGIVCSAICFKTMAEVEEFCEKHYIDTKPILCELSSEFDQKFWQDNWKDDESEALQRIDALTETIKETRRISLENSKRRKREEEKALINTRKMKEKKIKEKNKKVLAIRKNKTIIESVKLREKRVKSVPKKKVEKKIKKVLAKGKKKSIIKVVKLRK